MKRFLVLTLVFIFALSLPSVAFAEPAQIATGIVEEAIDGACVRISVDLADNWSAAFYPMAFCLYDQPVYEVGADYLAYGVLLNETSYASILEAHADDEMAEKDGYVVYTIADGETSCVAPLSEGLYLLLLVDPSLDADAVFARVACQVQDYSNAPIPQTVSGVVTDGMDENVQVRVTLDLTDTWSARFYPMAFYLCSQDCETEDDFDAYGTLLSEQSFASIVEGHAGEETWLEKADGTIVYTTADGQTGFIAPVAENEYIMLIVSPPWDAEAMWARVSYEIF